MLTLLTTILKKPVGDAPIDVLDRILGIQDDKMAHLTDVMQPSANAEPRHTFTARIPASQTSIAKLSPRQRLTLLPTMLRLVREMNRSGDFYKEPFAATRTQATADFIAALKQRILDVGATAVQFVNVPADAIFTGKAIPEPNAIVFSVHMNKAALDTAPSFAAFLEVARGYLRMAIIANQISRYLRAHGYAAYPGTALGGLTDYARIAELAGLGTIGYHGLLITPEDGALLRLNSIYTNIDNLPLEKDNPHGWIRDFCARCNKCIRECPAKAIFKEPQVQANGRVKCIDAAACLDYFAANYGCAVCVDVCPFSQVGYAAVRERFKGNPGAPRFDIPMFPPLAESAGGSPQHTSEVQRP